MHPSFMADGAFQPIASLTTVAGALGAVLALIWVLQAGRRRLPGRHGVGARRLAQIETLALDNRHRLHLVRCENRLALVQTGGAGHAMQWLPDGAAEAGPAPTLAWQNPAAPAAAIRTTVLHPAHR